MPSNTVSEIDPNIRLNSDLVAIPRLRDRLRKLRWFISAFKVHTGLVEQETGKRFTIDEGRLNAVFFDWVDLLGARRKGMELDLPDFIVFAAGLALTCLARHDPISVNTGGGDIEDDAPPPPDPDSYVLDPNLTPDPDVWPAGYLYVTFCLSVIAALETQEFERVLSRVHEEASDPVFWGSLCENISADSRLAVPYLDRLLGKPPNWEHPDAVLERPVMRQAVRDRLAADGDTERHAGP